MARLFSVAAMALLMSATASASDLRQFKIEVSENCIRVDGADFSASAQYVSFDTVKELLVLDGSVASPVTLTQHRDKKIHEISAGRIRYSLKNGKIVADAVRLYQGSVEPH